VPQKHLYDAFALLWSARRVFGHAAKRIPVEPEWTMRGFGWRSCTNNACFSDFCSHAAFFYEISELSRFWRRVLRNLESPRNESTVGSLWVASWARTPDSDYENR